jgi:LPS-assembly protein
MALGIALSLSVASPTVRAQQACPGDLPPPAPLLPLDRDDAEVVVDASNADLSREGVSVMSGHVSLTRADQTLETDRLTLYHDRDEVAAEGSVRYSDRDLSLSADSATMDLAADTADLEQVDYELTAGFGRGTASGARMQGEGRTWLSDVTFTTCPRGNSDWQLSAKEMTLDHETGEGEARGLGLRFKGVPLLYLPWASFPLDDRRKSGFLFPSIGSSDDDGLDLAIPYYWNIAPNQDATLSPRWISDRGAMLQGEYRFLTSNSFGELDVQYMPDDDRFIDPVANSDDSHRAYASFRNVTRLGENWIADVDLRHVSDEQFFEDFGNSLTASSISFLRSRAELRTQGEWWRGALMLDAYQTLDRDITPAREPFDRLPRFYFEGTKPLGGSNLYLQIGAEAAAFDRDFGLEGNRVDLYPRLSWPIYRPAGYLLPTVGVRYTGYDLDRADNDSPSRTTPIATMEGGLVFERGLSNGRVQTLEPRIHYLYVPFEDQSDLPTFDTTELTFSFNQLFRSNRFTGADRQTDANQLSLALTTRIIDSSKGRQVLDASIGTIAYFRDQRVQLAGMPVQDQDTSPIVGEVNWRPTDFWRLALGVQWDPEDDELQQGLVDVRYSAGEGRIFNLAYRRRVGFVEQVDLSALWPLNEEWSVVGRYNYSLLDDQLLEGLLGFEYDSCCWAVRFMGRRFIRNQDGDARNGVYFELELKGLGSLGRSTERVLERAILGYQQQDNLFRN